jgi:hypothetical protein
MPEMSGRAGGVGKWQTHRNFFFALTLLASLSQYAVGADAKAFAGFL